MDDVRASIKGCHTAQYHLIPAAVTKNKNIIMNSFKSSGDIQRKRVGQTAVSDNLSSSVTLNEHTMPFYNHGDA